jgi:tetratricopeptide (TPR) repeat protein
VALKRKRDRLFFIFCICCVLITTAQSFRKADSIKQVLKGNLHDTVRVKSLNALAKIYWTQNPDTSLIILREAIGHATKSKDEKNLAASYIFYGYVLGATGQFDSAMATYKAALQLSEKILHVKFKGMSLAGIGNTYNNTGEYAKAVPYFIAAIKEQEKCADSGGLARTYNSLGVLFEYQGDYKKSLEYHLKGLAIKERLKDVLAVATSLNNVGVVYMSLKDYDKAEEYLKRSLEIRLRENDLAGIGMCYSNLGGVYNYREDYKNSVRYHVEAVRYFEKLGDETGIAKSYFNLGGEYIKMGKADEALTCMRKAEATAEAYGLKQLQKDIYSTFYGIYETRGDYKKAFEYSMKYIEVKDSLLNEAKYHEIASLSTKFETEKKEKEIKMLSQQNEISRLDNDRKKLLLFAAMGGIVVLILLAFFILRSNWQKKQANVLLHEKNMLIEMQKSMVEQKNSEITSSIVYARRIQDALMTSEKNVGRMLSRAKKTNNLN